MFKILSQLILLELEALLKICGDIHGEYYDLIRLFEYGSFPPERNYLFQQIMLTEIFKNNVFYQLRRSNTLRGNNECASISTICGFYDECKRRYNIKLWKTFTECFNCQPIFYNFVFNSFKILFLKLVPYLENNISLPQINHTHNFRNKNLRLPQIHTLKHKQSPIFQTINSWNCQRVILRNKLNILLLTTLNNLFIL